MGARVEDKMIFIIDICKEKLHYYEFVKPIEDILKENKIKFFTKPYKKLNKSDLEKAEKVIICGTSLFDNDFFGNYHDFDWMFDYPFPILGICGGMHLIGMVFGNKIHTRKGLFKKKTGDVKCFLFKKTEIGFYKEEFIKEFFGLVGEQEVYHLHNYYVRFGKDFLIFAGGKCAQAVKHKKKEIYGVLFHPEVRNKDLIIKFCSLQYKKLEKIQ